ncbi:efflux RND transporter periplasmic adaptor subunit [Candidatus Uabimicrobium amorphum]|uniref:Acriflavin resistance protein n=1 Tax=Uabimicrobium amorphum TaxID=2596890 RepID=A0A5S9IQV2_UABAM|nr:efflux RND transporter periplasmic adaptor subunit [Candidatus Uabimicrobium amorphum]BBM85500.1 acriflavin resistance protein [Candidatus Uabimicrobium amorphum]
MNKNKATFRKVKISIVFCALFLIAGITANNLLALLKKEPEKVEKIQAFTTVKVQEMLRENYREKIKGYGTVEPILETTISAQVSGVVTWISPRLRRGQVFNVQGKPQKLLQIDDRDLRQQFISAQANLQKAQAAVKALEIETYGTESLLNNAKKEWQTSKRELKRLNKLIKERGISPSELDRQVLQTSQSEKEVLRLDWQYKSQLNSRERVLADVALAKAQLQQVKNDLRRTTIYTPFSGYITDVHVNYGTRVTPGTPLLRIVNTDKVAVAISVAASRYGQIQMGATTDISLNSGRTWRGKVIRILPDVDTQTRTFQVFAEIDYQQMIIPSGIFAVCYVEGLIFENVFVVPRTAVIDDFVFVARRLTKYKNKAKVEKRRLSIRASTSEYMIVDDGLKNGDEIIITNVEEISEGSNVGIFSGYETSKQR